MKLQLSRRLWVLSQVMRQLWFVAAIYCIAGIATALLGILLNPYIPEGVGEAIGVDSVGSLLSIIASSMLTVLIFSLNTVVQASSAAASSATPRAVGTLLEDRTAQAALSTFLGSFIFSLVGLIALNTNLYGTGGRLVLFVATIAVIVLIIGILLRWINYLGRLGKVSRTIEQVEDQAITSMRNYRAEPFLGGTEFDGHMPGGLQLIDPPETGYLRFVDMAALDAVSRRLDADIYVLERPGAFMAAGRHIAGIELPLDSKVAGEDIIAEIAGAFTIGHERSYTQDPLYGLTVMSQIALRALSPAVNDPGTAIDVTTHLVRIMEAGERPDADSEPRYSRIHMPAIRAEEFFDAAFTAMSRDGANMAEVVIHLLHACRALGRTEIPEFSEMSRKFSTLTVARARETLRFQSDIERIERAADRNNASSPVTLRKKSPEQ
ncbi:DUF2254 domain-containing protein [uncultured Martelella sp.]|uniref:DUF2254 domain-containing protein n=1 Tax=uncultured Martelella sp. TaxID=392331 RepID=UPI0029C86B5D|nr:DUF2254 domain-containing protein [uncultured Martelella sp.]